MTARRKAPARKAKPGKAVRKKKAAASRKGARKASARKKSAGKKAASKKKAARKKGAGKKAATRKKAAKKRGRKKGAATSASGGNRARTGKRDNKTVGLIVGTAEDIKTEILKTRKPDLEFPIRSLGNVSYSIKKGYFEIGKQKKTRTLTVNTVRGFAQTLRLMGLSKDLIEANDFATKRDAYYQSKNWESAKFDDQTESDTVMDDIEAMFSMQGVSREQLRYVPDEHGGAVAGQLTVIDPDLETGQVERIDCTRFGSGAYSIPSTVEHLSFETKAKFILAIETGGIFQRLQSHKFWQRENCILVSLAGVPTRSTRRFIRKLSDECNLAVFAFVDCDPYGFSNIYRTLKVGSGNAAHISQFFSVPQTHYLGVTPQDIIDYELPTHPLLDVDIKRAKDALRNDPFFKAHKPWKKAIEQLISMGVRAEQQSLAMWGLNYVMDEYLPAKLKKVKDFLP